MELGQLVEELLKYGPLGLGALSFISNLFPGFPALYLSLVASYAALSPSALHSAAAVLAAGVGAGLGKAALFLSSSAIGSRIGYVRKKRKLLKRLLEGGKIPVLVFLFAALPLPDDLLYIPLAVVGYSPLQFLAPVIIGKTTMAAIVYALGLTAGGFLKAYLNSVGSVTLLDIAIAGLAVIAASLLLAYVVISIDWFKVLEGYARRGIRGAVRELLREALSLASKQK
ncbi:MAG: hypothetical protein N3F67_01855 [Acidilobaceae archaeon]|nr:hypothetical protein [Acidilobaceae archaeon]